jgi:hypothetical protein
MKLRLNHFNFVPCLFGIAIALVPGDVHAQKPSAPAAFSFDVYGDSRSMMYLPHKADQEAEARKLMVDMFELAVPPELAAGVVQKYVKLTYDPTSKELVQMVMPFITASEVTTLGSILGQNVIA